MSKTLVIGLDGVPLHLVEGWISKGKLPNLQRLIKGGAVGHLNSTTPHTSAAAWSSFMTGKNPGKTGIYDFLERRKNSYTFVPNNSDTRSGKAVWRVLSEAGKRVGILNVPLTYPVEKVNGVMLTGWMTPYLAKDVTYPPDFMKELEAAIGNYSIYPLETFSEDKREAYFAASHKLLRMLTDATLYTMRRAPWDFLMVVYFDTDRILHQLWHYLDPTHPFRRKDTGEDKSGPVMEYFSKLDESIGKLLEQAGDDTNVIIMSDHGMGPTRNMIVLNTWLLQKGLIHLKKNPLSLLKYLTFKAGFTLRSIHQIVDHLGLAKHAEYKLMYSVDYLLKKIFLSFDDVDWSKTKAYSFGRSNGPIYLNVRGREPKGIIEPGEEYNKVRAEIANMAAQMTDPRTKEKLVGKVTYREDIYTGSYLEIAPDLTIDPSNEKDKFYGLSDFGANRVVEPMYRYSGMHRQFGLMILNGPAIKQGVKIEGANIIDIFPTILTTLDTPIPDDIDGRPLLEALEAEKAKTIKWVSAEGEEGSTRKEANYTDEEVSQIEDRLRKLGYLG